MELIAKKIFYLDLKDNEIYLAGDFGKGTALVNKYQYFYQILSLNQLLTCPTRVTCNKFSLIDHILVKFLLKRSFNPA